MTVWHYCHLQWLRVDLDMIQITVLSSMEEGGGCGTSGDPSARQSCETLDKEDHFPLDHQVDHSPGEDLTLMWTGRPFGGLVADVKRKLPW